MADCMDAWDGPLKSCISLHSVCLVGSGLATLVLAAQAYSSDEFEHFAVMGAVESNDALDLRLMVSVALVSSVVAVVAGLSGCWGASHEKRCCLCGFCTLGAAGGVMLIFVCIMLGAFVKSEAPMILKAINRVCHPTSIEAFKDSLNCEGKPIHLQASGRLLQERWENSTSQVPEAASASRRLFPGMTEESLIVRACSRLGRERCASPCALLDLLCQEPDGFDPLTACVCDRSGPRAQGEHGFVTGDCPEDSLLCKRDVTGRALGVFCQAPNRSTTAEVCFVLPSAVCGDRGAVQPETCREEGTTPCVSSGPCSDPDSRSKVFAQGRTLGIRLAVSTGILGVTLTLTALCVLCLCCELNAGRSMTDQIGSLFMNKSLEGDNSDEEWS